MRNKAFTLIEMLVVVAIIALLIAILLPSLSKARELARQTTCSTHLRGIGQSCYIYQDANKGVFPTAPHRVNPATVVPDVDYIGNMGGGGTNGVDRDVPSLPGAMGTLTVSPTRSLWLMIRSGETVPKNFLCPSSDDTADPTVDVSTYFDFIGFGASSYGYQIPYDDVNPCKPSADVDPRMVLAADRGPWSAKDEMNEVVPDADPLTFFRDKVDPVAPELYTLLIDGMPVSSDPLLPDGENETTPPDLWKRFNSPNHGGGGNGAGQSVLYPDAHTEFRRTPLAGADSDNIYTKQAVSGQGQDPASYGDDDNETRHIWQWGVLPNPSSPVIPGFESFGEGFNSTTDTLIWP